MSQLSRIMGFARASLDFMQASLSHTAYFDLFEVPRHVNRLFQTVYIRKKTTIVACNIYAFCFILVR